MIELPIFISYRQADGSKLANWLYDSLRGRVRTLRSNSLLYQATVSPYLDRAAPAVGDWQDLLERELGRARALVVVCTPGATHETNRRPDRLYAEIRWWLEYRKTLAPILVSSSDHGLPYVPELLRQRWPRNTLVQVDPRAWLTWLPPPDLQQSIEAAIESILAGIDRSAEADHMGLPPDSMLSVPGLFTWEKDRHFRYINANENYARAAGYDSPQAMLGKTDDDMPWRSLADFFRSGDYEVMVGAEHSRECVPEKEVMVDRVADILVTEGQLVVRGKCIGVTGCFLDITGCKLGPARYRASGEGISLGWEFDDAYLTEAEVQVFRGMVRSLCPDEIAQLLGLTRAAVDSHILSIKTKLQCDTDGDVIATAVKAGLPLTLFGPQIGLTNVH